MTHDSTSPIDDMKQVDWRGMWAIVMAQCRVCSHEQCCIYPYPVCDGENMECGNCGNMTMDESLKGDD